MSPALLANAVAAVAALLDDPTFAAAVQQHRADPVAVLSMPLLDAHDVAALFKIPAKTVRQYAREGRLPCHRLGGRHVRFVRAEVEQAVLTGRLAP